VRLGYVSDERDVAIAGADVEVERDGETVLVARTTARGRILGDLPAGEYLVTLRHPDHGGKRTRLAVGPGIPPARLRLLSRSLLGYLWPRAVRAGELGETRFSSHEPYHLSLWRYGAQKEHVRDLGWYDEHGPESVAQVVPDGDIAATGVAWNRIGYGGNPHHTMLVPAPERSGLYYVHARGESGAFFTAPWVVAPGAGARTAPIAVVLSTNTWNAYNNFGGRSNYVNTVGLPDEPTVNARQDLDRFDASALGGWGHPDDDYQPLSFERPEPANHVPEEVRATDPIAGRLASSLAPAEWRLLAWLELEGLDYDVYSDHQLHAGVLELDRHRALIASVHPEYWSRAMFLAVSSWVDERGGRLAYLGGNGLNCEVRFIDRPRDGGDGAALQFRTYLLDTGGPLGMPDPEDPSIWYDSRFHRSVAPEAALLGVATTETGIMTAAPYRVAPGAASHWVFEGTGLADGAIFGERSLHERCPGGASGHETDKRTASTPAGAVLLAKGLNPDDGGAEIVYHETSSGGAVFSVGSIIWPSSLLVDAQVSQVTSNVLRRFIRER
jgi:N,N-dimethylformamidase